MDENKIFKPHAKHVNSKPPILRPSTDGHIQTNEVDPVKERNIPKNVDNLQLNLNAKGFIPKSMQYLYKNNNQNDPKNYKNNNYPMNMPPYYVYNNAQMNPNFMQNFNNYPTYNMPNQGAPYMQPRMNYAPPPVYPSYPPNHGNQGNAFYSGKNNYNNYQQNNSQNNYQGNKNYNNKETNNPQTKKPTTLLKLDSKSFIPKNREKKEEKNEDKKEEKKEENKDLKKDNNKNEENKDLKKENNRNEDNNKNEDNKDFKKGFESKEENKDENKKEKKDENTSSIIKSLNIKAAPYKPRNAILKQKEEKTHPNKEEKPQENKKDNPLHSLLSDTNKNTLAKKTSKKRDSGDKKTEGVNKNNEKITKDEEREEKLKEEEQRRKLEEEPIIERKYFITFKNKKSQTNEQFTFEYIMQFKKWKICKEDDLLPNEVKSHFAGFKEEIKEGGKKKKDRDRDRDRDDANKKKENNQAKNAKEATPEVSLEKWARKDMTKEIKAAEEFKKKLMEEKGVDVIKKDLRDLLNKLTPDNYNDIKDQILEKIKADVGVQDKFLDVLFQKAVLEKAYVKLYSKLVKDLDKDLPQKIQRKEKNKKEYSEMRSHLIDKCRTIFKIENNEKFDEYIKEKDPEDRRNKLKKFFLGNVNFITELMKIKILSKKVGPDCLKNLYDRCQKVELDKTLRELTIEAIIVFTEKFGRIIYEEDKTIKAKDKEEYQAQIDDIFKKLAKIKEEEGLVGYIKYGIVNLEEKRKHNFAMSKFDESQIAKTKKQVEEELENEGQITQENINNRMKNELKDYKDSLNPRTEEEEENENKNENDIWKETSFILDKRTTYGKTFGDILEGFFENAAEIIDEEKNPDYLKKYINELIDYYYDNFSPKDIKELRERLIKLFSDLIIDIALDIPGIYDLYAYVLNLFMEFRLMKFNDLSELKRGEVNIDHLSKLFQDLKKYYENDDDFKKKMEELPYVKNNREKFE